MIASIEINTEGIAYTQLTIGPDDADDEAFFITFRRYFRRVYVGVEDYSDQITWGTPVEEITEAPSYIIERTVFERFNGERSFFRALKFLGEIGVATDPELEAYYKEYWTEQWQKLVPKYTEWVCTPLPAGAF